MWFSYYTKPATDDILKLLQYKNVLPCLSILVVLFGSQLQKSKYLQ